MTIKENHPFKSMFAPVERVETPDARTAVIRMSNPHPAILLALSGALCPIIPKHIYGDGQDPKTHPMNLNPIGSGPFKFVEYVPGDRIVMTANADYWGGKPKWDKVTMKPIKSGPSRVAALLAGDVDVIEGVPTADITRLKKDPKLQLSSGTSNRVIYLHIDHNRDDSPYVKAADGGAIKNPLKDARVRKAISMEPGNLH